MKTTGATFPACPACGQLLERRRRNLLDRLRSLFGPKARYRCSARCGWEGLLTRASGDSRAVPPKARSASYSARKML